jgi:hypothetical protein
MRDVPRLLKKLNHIRKELDRFEEHLTSQYQEYEDAAYQSRPDVLFSEVMQISRSAGELIQNFVTAWRKGMKES